MTSRFFAASLAVLAGTAVVSLATACGDSIGNYCDYTDCNASPDAASDAASDGAANAADAGSDAS